MASKTEILITARNQASSAFRSIERDMDGLQSASRRLKDAFVTLGVTLSVRQLSRMADEYQGIQARLKLATRSADEFAAANQNIQRIAASTQSPLQSTAVLYTRISQSLLDVGGSQKQVADTTQALALALRISNAAEEESTSAMLQFSQAIASGTLRGEEFNAVNEAAPRLMKALADSLDVPVGKLREMAKEGQLTRDILVNGLGQQLPQLMKEAETLPNTIGAAFTALGNQALLTVGQLDRITGASQKVASAIGLITQGMAGWANFMNPSEAQQTDKRLEYLRGQMDNILTRRRMLGAVGIDSSQFWSDQLQKLNEEALSLQRTLAELQLPKPQAPEQALPKLPSSADDAAVKRQQTFLDGLRKEAETLGMTSVQQKLYEARMLGIRGASLELVRANAERIQSYQDEQAALKSASEAYLQAEDAYTEFLAAAREDSRSATQKLERLQLELSLGQQTEAQRTRALALYDLEYQAEERLRRLRGLGLDESVQRIQEEALARWKLNEQEAIRLQAMVDMNREASQRISQFTIQAARNMQSAFADFLFDPFEKGLDGMAVGFLNTVRRMAANAAAAGLFNSLFGDGKNDRGIAGGLLQAAGSSVFSKLFPAFADGGYHSGGLRLVGERGPELEVTGPARIYNPAETRALLSGGGGDTININLTIQAGVSQTVRAEVMSMLPAIQQKVIAGVADAKKRGRNQDPYGD